MNGYEFHGFEFCGGYWWIFPLVMIIFCFLFMRRGFGRGWCGFDSRWSGWDRAWPRDSARDILDRLYARGEIDRKEYEEKRKVLDDEPASAERQP